MKKQWLTHGLLNTLEHFITRFSDAFVSLVLVWALSPEVFGQLALAQATLTPFMLLFLSPETVIYRDYAKWKEQGPLFISNQLSVFRKFSWLKLFVAFLLSFILSFFLKKYSSSYTSVSYIDLLFSFFWGVTLLIAPQVLGTDREFLRLELKFVEINYLTILQKLLVVISTVCASFLFSGDIKVLFLLNFLSFLMVVFAQFKISNKILSIQKTPLKKNPQFFSVIAEAFFSFSLWNHFIGVIHGWLQNISLMLLAYTSVTAREIGLFSTVLKFGNFTLLIPTALGQLFSIWIGRRLSSSENLSGEKKKIFEFSLALIVIGALQLAVFYFLCPYVFQFFSKGRWTDLEIQNMLQWVFWILIGNIWIGPVFLISSWMNLRALNKKLFFNAYLPIAIISLGVMSFFIMSEDLLFISQGQSIVMLIYVSFLVFYFLKYLKKFSS